MSEQGWKTTQRQRDTSYAYWQAHKSELAEKHRAYRQTDQYKQRLRARNHRYEREQTMEARIKRRARKKLRYHVLVGNITRLPCVKCGNPESHGHHHDYSKPLDVEWLCRTCHRKEHDAEKRRGRA